MPKLYIATPAYGAQLHAAYVSSLLEAQKELIGCGVSHSINFEPGDSLVSRARNCMVARFMQTDADRFLFIDGDLGFKGEDVLRLLADLESDDLDVVCGIYPRKSRELTFPVNFVLDGDRHLTRHVETGCIEINDAPTGFMMFKRSVIERMIAVYPERKCRFRESSSIPEYSLFDCFIDDNGVYLSEDFGFSRLWQRIGGRLWADPEIELAHYGQWKYTGSLKSVFRPEGPPKKAQDIDGWMTAEELACLSGLAAGASSVIEIGSWKGRSTFALLSSCKGPVYAVDHWRGSQDEREGPHKEAVTGDVFAEFMANVGHFQNLVPIRMASLDAAESLSGADVVFIDGGHSYEEVKADIAAWRGKARKVLAGHDYNWPGVKQAVDEALGPVQVVGSIWIHHVGQ